MYNVINIINTTVNYMLYRKVKRVNPEFSYGNFFYFLNVVSNEMTEDH